MTELGTRDDCDDCDDCLECHGTGECQCDMCKDPDTDQIWDCPTCGGTP